MYKWYTRMNIDELFLWIWNQCSINSSKWIRMDKSAFN